MTKYTNEKKEHALSQMSAPHNKPVVAVAQLTGVPEATILNCGSLVCCYLQPVIQGSDCVYPLMDEQA